MNKDLHTGPGGPSGIHEDLLAKYLLGETSPDDNARVEAWLAADPANRHFYNHFQLIWRESRHLDDDFRGTDEHTEAAWQKFRQKIHQAPPLQAVKDMGTKHIPGRAGWTTWPAWTKAAAATLIIASITVVRYLTRSAGPDKMVASTTVPLTDTLPDGSLITLNRRSGIHYPSNFKRQRTVHLQGEAFFKIAPDNSNPFKVYAGNVTITVLGTSFNVRNKGAITEIIVESGLIRVTDSLHDVLVHPSEKLVLRTGDIALSRDSARDQLYKYYRTKDFVCDNTTLPQLAATLEEAYDVHIDIDPSLRHLQINTVFHNQSLDQILNIIKETFRIRITRMEGKIILQP
ncbi:MAG TPA: FecR domain-containing protein [Puia sp.]